MGALPTELTGDRLILRVPVERDAHAVAAAVRSSLAELQPWMPWATDEYDRTDALAWIRREFGDAHPFVMLDPVDGEVVGSCGLNRVDELNRSANLGYWVRTDRAGRGHATEATRLLADYGLRMAGFHRLEISMSVHNEASRRVAEKAGAGYEGIARSALLLRGELHDAHRYAVVADDLDG